MSDMTLGINAIFIIAIIIATHPLHSGNTLVRIVNIPMAIIYVAVNIRPIEPYNK